MPSTRTRKHAPGHCVRMVHRVLQLLWQQRWHINQALGPAVSVHVCAGVSKSMHAPVHTLWGWCTPRPHAIRGSLSHGGWRTVVALSRTWVSYNSTFIISDPLCWDLHQKLPRRCPRWCRWRTILTARSERAWISAVALAFLSNQLLLTEGMELL